MEGKDEILFCVAELPGVVSTHASYLGDPWFTSLPLGKFLDNILKYAITTSSDIFQKIKLEFFLRILTWSCMDTDVWKFVII
jgi:hypothetical protein